MFYVYSNLSEYIQMSFRPEHSGPPELYYNDDEAAKYARNSHIVTIQAEMTERALELLALPEDKIGFLLDVGCGTGISGEVLSTAGHYFVGVDISYPMLKIAKSDQEDEEDATGDFIHKDMGTGMPFRPGSFDGAISISAIQWMCHANASDQNPRKRLYRFFQSLYACLGRGSRAVFQFYPENEAQTELIMSQATRSGFNGGLVIDYPNSTKARKVYLVLMTGGMAQMPKALTGDEVEDAKRTQVDNTDRSHYEPRRKKGKKPVKGSREWIEAKREKMVKQGKDVRHSSKFTGRKRRVQF